MAPKNHLKLYENVRIESVAHGGRRVDLVVTLYDHVVQSLSEAKIFLKQEKYLECGRSCSRALTILAGLRETLDFEHGEPVATSLLKFYNVVTSKVIGAQTRKNDALLSEAIELVESVKSAWSHLASKQVETSTQKAVVSKLVDAHKASAAAPSGAGVAAAV